MKSHSIRLKNEKSSINLVQSRLSLNTQSGIVSICTTYPKLSSQISSLIWVIFLTRTYSGHELRLWKTIQMVNASSKEKITNNIMHYCYHLNLITKKVLGPILVSHNDILHRSLMFAPELRKKIRYMVWATSIKTERLESTFDFHFNFVNFHPLAHSLHWAWLHRWPCPVKKWVHNFLWTKILIIPTHILKILQTRIIPLLLVLWVSHIQTLV